MADRQAITLHASGSETSNGASAAVDVSTLRTALRLQLDVTALSGTTPTLTVSVETSPSGAGDWKTLGAFAVVNESSARFEELSFGECERYVRASWVLGGTTPDFTFAVGGNAHVLYVRPADLTRYAVQAQGLSGIAAGVLVDCCLRATDDAEAAFNGAYVMPITAWGEDVRGRVGDIAVYYAMKHRGLRPGSADDLLVKAYDDAQRWLQRVSDGKISPPSILDSTPSVFDAGAYSESEPKRGW